MANKLQILIESGIKFNQSQVQQEINKLKNNNIKLNVAVDTSSVAKLDSSMKSVSSSSRQANTSLQSTNATLSAMKDYYTQIENEAHRYDDVIKQMDRDEQIYWNNKSRNAIESLTAQNNITRSMKDYYTQLERVTKEEQKFNEFKQKMNNSADNYSNRYSWVTGAKDKMEEFKRTLNSVVVENGNLYRTEVQADGQIRKYATSVNELKNSFAQTKQEISGNISLFDRVGQSIKNSLKNIMSYYSVGTMMYKGMEQVKEAFSYTNEMNKLETNAMIITGKSREEVAGLTQEYISLGKELGAVSTKVGEIGEAFLRQGRNASETKELIKATTEMAQLSGLGTTESTEYLTSIVNGFKVSAKDAEDVVSKLVSVDNNAATSVSELSEALSKVSSVANASGVSLDNLIGYIGTISETTRQDAGSIGKSHCRYV